ncbi:uncharacterized protein EKO05_0003684 [Ascochyta rabiei]|uniref:Transferase n=1 Tax=Didymella rabiei TaxID=5454 RepID=A0A162YUH4_DIDRA|nr:uncharacterized protein EKO05_0003684 [Ascochyta rabiei]KZM20233.1 transferase [Ascochyta rabiei]UPX13158.1 hypothetical protein EKO05_0003684 [Ascochyta rabiei]
MAFGHFGSKAATRDSNNDINKAQAANKDISLSQRSTKKSNEILSETKLELEKQWSKTAGASCRCADPEPTASAIKTSDFTIPPIEFSQNNLSVVTTTTLKTSHHTGVSELVSEDCINTTLNARYSDSISTVSVLPNDGEIIEDLSSNNAASIKIALLAQTTTTTPLHNSTQPSSLPKVSTVINLKETVINIIPVNRSERSDTMANKESKDGRQILAQVFYKLKAKLWPWHHDLSSSIEVNVEEDEKEDFSDRCQWDIITKVEPTKIKEIVRSALSGQGYDEKSPLVITSYEQGSYHFVIMLKTLHPYTKKAVGWVVKIPGHGTPERWTAEDNYMLTQEVETMRLLTMETDIPSPWVVDYSATLDNKYGFPYIVMKELPGSSANELWFEQHCEVPTIETELKRLTFLRSLACHMTELNKLHFDQIGMPMYNVRAPDFEDYENIEAERLPVNKYYVWPYYDTYDSIERGPFPSTQAYIQHARGDNELAPPAANRKLTATQVEAIGTNKLLDMIFTHPVFHSTSKSTFALRHSDLDTQNILVDGSGAITGILDWDGSLAMPRCVGHAAVPHFLERDVHADALFKTPFLCWRAPHYRSVYAAALAEAGNPDAKYTSKSHLYQAGFAALYEGGDMQGFLKRLLSAIPEMHLELGNVKFLLAKGCKATEEMLKVELGKVLEPELPEEGFLERVEKQYTEAAVRVWMDGFENLAVDGM